MTKTSCCIRLCKFRFTSWVEVNSVPPFAAHSLDGPPCHPPEVPGGFPETPWCQQKVLVHGFSKLPRHLLLCLNHGWCCHPPSLWYPATTSGVPKITYAVGFSLQSNGFPDPRCRPWCSRVTAPWGQTLRSQLSATASAIEALNIDVSNLKRDARKAQLGVFQKTQKLLANYILDTSHVLRNFFFAELAIMSSSDLQVTLLEVQSYHLFQAGYAPAWF